MNFIFLLAISFLSLNFAFAKEKISIEITDTKISYNLQAKILKLISDSNDHYEIIPRKIPLERSWQNFMSKKTQIIFRLKSAKNLLNDNDYLISDSLASVEVYSLYNSQQIQPKSLSDLYKSTWILSRGDKVQEFLAQKYKLSKTFVNSIRNIPKALLLKRANCTFSISIFGFDLNYKQIPETLKFYSNPSLVTSANFFFHKENLKLYKTINQTILELNKLDKIKNIVKDYFLENKNLYIPNQF